MRADEATEAKALENEHAWLKSSWARRLTTPGTAPPVPPDSAPQGRSHPASTAPGDRPGPPRRGGEEDVLPHRAPGRAGP